jgi:hypothetical protein
MNRPSLRTALGAAVFTAGLMATAAPAAHADPITPGWDDTFVIDSCPFPIEVHDTVTWFKEIITLHAVKDIRAGRTLDFTNLDTGKTWHVTGDVTSSWADHPDGSVTLTVDGVWAAAGPLHTVYYGHWTRVFPDGIPGPIPFVGSGKTVDICEQLS